MERLCSNLSPTPPAPAADADADAAPSSPPPRATEFRWVAIPLGMLVQSGTFARRRKFLYRVVTRDLGLGGRRSVGSSNNGGDEDEEKDGGHGGGGGCGGGGAGRASDDRQTAKAEEEAAAALSPIEETWMARVLLPALDQVGWHRCVSHRSFDKDGGVQREGLLAAWYPEGVLVRVSVSQSTSEEISEDPASSGPPNSKSREMPSRLVLRIFS